MALGTNLGILAQSGVDSTPFSNIYSLDFDGTADHLMGEVPFQV